MRCVALLSAIANLGPVVRARAARAWELRLRSRTA
jgi:hypothetical protein